MSLAVVPIRLGCCPEPERCRICAPLPSPATPELVDALIGAVREEQPERELRVRFFGGPPPSDSLIEAAGAVPFDVRVRPDLLDRAAAARLHQAGVVGIELDALTFHTPALRAVRRRYAGPRLVTMLEGLGELGVERGIVLAVGLPGQDHDTSLQDAATATGLVETARLHPLLVLKHSDLWHAHLDGRYEPLSLGQAVTTVSAMLDRLEPAGVEVIRVGQQPGPDGLGKWMAGPRHSSLRELVEARRTLARLRNRLRAVNPGGVLVIRCATADETRTRGPLNDNVRTLRAEFGFAEVIICADPTLERGEFILEAS